MKPRGLYELLLTRAVSDLLAQLQQPLAAVKERLRSADAADRMAFHVQRVVQKAIDDLPEGSRVATGIELVERLVREIASTRPDLLSEVPSGDMLAAIASRLPDGTAEVIPHPLIPLLDTALLTNAPGEPRVGSQVLAEIPSADRIDVVMAFIRKSGIAPLVPSLQKHCSANRGLIRLCQMRS